MRLVGSKVGGEIEDPIFLFWFSSYAKLPRAFASEVPTLCNYYTEKRQALQSNTCFNASLVGDIRDYLLLIVTAGIHWKFISYAAWFKLILFYNGKHLNKEAVLNGNWNIT